MDLRPLGLLLATGVSAACMGTTNPPTSDEDRSTASASTDLRVPTIPFARASLLAADAEASNEATLRGVPGLLANMDDDVTVLLRRQNILTGKQAVADYFAAAPVTGSLGWRQLRGDVSALGDFGYTVGWLEIFDVPDADGNVAAHYSVYAAVWHRRFDRRWTIAAFSKTDLGGPPAPPPPGLVPLTNDGPVYPTGKGAHATTAELLATDTAFASYTAKVGQQLGFDAYVAEDAVSINDPLVLGRKAIFDSNAGIPSSSVLRWTPLVGGAAQTGDLGWTVGTYASSYVDDAGAPGVSYGKYLTIWKRQADGTFKWVLDGGSSSPPPATAP